MAKDKTPTGVQYKLPLLVVCRGSVLADRELENYLEEEEVLIEGDQLSEEQMKRRQKRGMVLDYRNILKQLIGIPKGEKGANYNEMLQVKPILEMLNDAISGETVLMLDKTEYKLVRTRVLEHNFPQVDLDLIGFIGAVDHAEKVDVKPVTEEEKPE